MIYIVAFLWCIPSAVIWVFNAELFVLLAALAGARHPWLLALAAGAGQTAGFCALYLFGERILRWRLLSGTKAKLATIDPERLRTGGITLLLLGGFIGLPPMTALAVVAGSLRWPLWKFAVLCFAGRSLRYGVSAYAPQTVMSILHIAPKPLPFLPDLARWG